MNARSPFLQRYLISTLGLLTLSFSAIADDHIFDIPLEQLANLKVSVTSKNEESLSDSSGSLAAFTQNHIADLSYYTLEKLADITPGYSTRKSLGNTVFETRGTYGDLNAKHLLLLDGIPVNFARDYQAIAQEQLPLHFAEQVEFLRGPASALYGVSAFNGVINISSQELDEEGSRFTGYISKGSFDSEQRQMFTNLFKSPLNSVHFSYGHYSKQDSLSIIPGYSPLEIDEDNDGAVDRTYNVNNRLRDGQSSQFMYLKYSPNYLNLSDFSFGIINMKKQSNYWESWNGGQDTSEINREVRDSWIYYIKYNKAIYDNLALNTYLKYNDSRERGIQHNKIWSPNPGVDDWLFNFDVQTSNYESLIEVNWQADKSNNFIMGINYDIRYQKEPGSFLFETDNSDADIRFFTRKARTRSFYSQYTKDLDVFNGLSLIFGLRNDEGTISSNSYNETSPRIAVVQKLNDNINLKLLQGHALKAPGIVETSHNFEKSNSLVNINDAPSVQPEVIDVYEFVATYSNGGVLSSLTYFDNTIKDSIIRRELDCSLYAEVSDPNSCDNNNRTGDQPDFFLNDPETRNTDGIELDIQYQGENHWVIFNFSHTNMNTKSDLDIANPPERKINLAGHRKFKTPIQIGATLIIKNVNQYLINNGRSVSGQTLVDSKLNFNLKNNINLDIQILNIFDEQYFQISNGSNEYMQPGREVLLTLDFSF